MSIPLILPLLGWGVVTAIVGFFSYAGFKGIFDDPKKNKLGILGMQAAGKTKFLCYLRNVPFIEKQTSREKYESFIFKLRSGKEIHISPGIDIGGGRAYISEYNNILDKSDAVLYFFDINTYLNNIIIDDRSYQRDCNARFEHIYSEVCKSKKPTLIIATHKDKCKFSQNDIEEKFHNLIHAKSYKDMLKDVEYVDLTNSNDLKKIANKIFNN